VVVAGLLSVGAAVAESGLDRLAEEDGRLPVQAAEITAGARINDRLNALADETGRLRAEVAAQSDLLRRLMLGLDGLIPVSPQQDLGSLESTPEGLKACRSEIAELSARLRQQGLVVDQAQRRAEKAEKGAAAMSEAQAHAATEIERLSTELATAKTRQSEALQQAVELERRLATAEARLARLTESPSSQSKGAIAGADPVPTEPAVALVDVEPEGDATEGDSSARAASAPVAVESSEPRVELPTAPVFYEVRAADTLSRISARVYGDASAWERIYDANRDLLTAPDALSPGMSLVIP
jgi:nucleoid-associated protein YgaU